MVNLLRDEQFSEAELMMREIQRDFDLSTEEMEDSECSGEVFLALFDYFDSAFDIDIRKVPEAEKISLHWREMTGDHDMVAFLDRASLLSLEERIDLAQLTQYVNDFFEIDYGNAAQAAYTAFFHNLKKVKAGDILLWRLY